MTIEDGLIGSNGLSNSAVPRWAELNKYVGPESFDSEGLTRFRMNHPIDRMGLYLFECANGDIYIGMARDVARRLRNHVAKHPDVVRFWFRPDKGSDVERRTIERMLVRDAQKSGLTVRNREHASGHVGASALDALISVNEQGLWSENPALRNAADSSELIDLGPSKLAAHARDFAKLLQHPRFEEIVQVLGRYAAQCIPLPRRTEATFWTVSCYPSSNKQRVFCVSLAGQEVFYVFQSERSSKLRAMLYVDRRELRHDIIGKVRMRAHRMFPRRGGHKYGGAFEQALYFRDIRDLSKALVSTDLPRAASRFNLDLMRKRQSAYKTSHCRQLAEAALCTSQSTTTEGI